VVDPSSGFALLSEWMEHRDAAESYRQMEKTVANSQAEPFNIGFQ
jgi:hypothetical protein